jgi:O-methyltransferase domain
MPEPNPFAAIQQLSAGYFASRCLHVVAELGIADALEDTPTRVESLAKAMGANEDALARVLRLLDTYGVFRLENGVVSHTPASVLLRSDSPTSMRDFARMFGLSLQWRSAEMLLDSVRTGEAAAPRAFEGGFWGHLSAHPEEARVFDAAMNAKSWVYIDAILAQYDFSGFNHIVDVGGGQGHLIRAILKAHPNVTGTLFDQPHVIEAARAGGDEQGRLKFVGGDFFKDDLPRADAYILMEVIHDWADAPASQILETVRKSAQGNAALLLIETEVPESREPDWSKTLDIVMLALFAAKQRTVAEYRALLEPIGLTIETITDTGAGISVFDARQLV